MAFPFGPSSFLLFLSSVGFLFGSRRNLPSSLVFLSSLCVAQPQGGDGTLEACRRRRGRVLYRHVTALSFSPFRSSSGRWTVALLSLSRLSPRGALITSPLARLWLLALAFALFSFSLSVASEREKGDCKEHAKERTMRERTALIRCLSPGVPLFLAGTPTLSPLPLVIFGFVCPFPFSADSCVID